MNHAKSTLKFREMISFLNHPAFCASKSAEFKLLGPHWVILLYFLQLLPLKGTFMFKKHALFASALAQNRAQPTSLTSRTGPASFSVYPSMPSWTWCSSFSAYPSIPSRTGHASYSGMSFDAFTDGRTYGFSSLPAQTTKVVLCTTLVIQIKHFLCTCCKKCNNLYPKWPFRTN